MCADYVQNSKQLKILFLLNYYMKDFKQLTLMLFLIKKRTKYTDNTATDYYYKVTSYVNNQESGLSDPISEDLFCNAYRKS